MNAQAIRRAAILLGRKGGLIGGPARAKALSQERRREIAKKAGAKGLAARWMRYRRARAKKIEEVFFKMLLEKKV